MAQYTQKPIETREHGETYDSVLEARWGESLRVHGLDPEHHPAEYDLHNGLIVTPDYLIHGGGGDMFGESKWHPSGADKTRLECLSEETGLPSILLLPDGLFEIYTPHREYYRSPGWHPGGDCMLVYCKKCGRYSFVWRGGDYACKCGTRSLKDVIILYFGNGERGRIEDAKKYFGRTAYYENANEPWHKPLYPVGKPESIKQIGETGRGCGK